MTDWLLEALFSWGIPVGGALFAAFFCIFALAIFITNVRAAALVFLIVVLIFVNPSYGFVDQPEFSVYSKGGATFFFPWIQYYLYGLFMATAFLDSYQNKTVLADAGRIWMLGFAVLFILHIGYGLASGLSIFKLLSTAGLLNVIHMIMVAYIAASAIRDEKALKAVATALVAIVFIKGCHGLVRYFFFGGDPQNAYANISGMAIRITFWDFNEGLLATIAVFYCAWRLTREWADLKFESRAFFIAVIVVEVLVILFSYRRTNWIGFLFAGIYFVWLLPKGTRTAAAVAFVLVSLPPVVFLGGKRQQEALGQRNLSLIEKIAPDALQGGGITSRESRFFEHFKVAEVVARNPLMGGGLAGVIDVGFSSKGFEWRKGRYDFVHSGLGHVMLKSGIPGLILFCGSLIAAWRFASRGRAALPKSALPLFECFRAGMMFLLPVLLFGSPIAEFRSMVLLGAIVGIPVGLVFLRNIKTEAKNEPPTGKYQPRTVRGYFARGRTA